MGTRSSASVDNAHASSTKTYVLVHGAYHGGWCWRDVASRLRSMGHTVHTPTLTGLGERSHLLSVRPTLDMFVEDIAQVFRYEDVTDAVLVGHSFAGSVISGVADRMPERLRHLVYLDALVLNSGESSADRSPERIEAYRQKALGSGDVHSVPASDPKQFDIFDPAMAAWVAPKLTPHPLQTYFDKLRLDNPLCNGVPATYIACSAPFLPNTAESRKRAKAIGWAYLEIPTGHDAMVSMPVELTDMLAKLGESPPSRQAA